MWKTRVYWWRKDDGDFAESERKSEMEAREYARSRSLQVQGGCYVLFKGSPVSWYQNGIDEMSQA